MTARSMQFCSSRTLPGQECARERRASRPRTAQSRAGPSRGRNARGRSRRGAGCRPGAGAAAGSRSGTRRGGRTGPRGTASRPTSPRRSRLVAATTRTSTVSVWSPPTRSNCLSWTRRRILACSGSGRSPISSRNSVPWCASSTLPDLAAGGAGEGALLVAEQLVLQQGLGDRRAVDGDEGALGAGGELVQRAAHQLLAGAALAEEQHGGVGAGRPLHRQHGLLERRILTEHARQAEARAGTPPSAGRARSLSRRRSIARSRRRRR